MAELFTYRTAEEVAAESKHNSNPFGLVYSGSITENVPGKVNIIPVSYTHLDVYKRQAISRGWKNA